MKGLTTASRKARSVREFVRGLTHTAHPLLVQIIPIRKCNIDCGYCNEYDVARTQREMKDDGLPSALAARLALGQ